MATTTPSKLRELYQNLRPAHPVTSAELSAMGISRDLAVHYVRAGWLRRLARGVYSRPDAELELDASLRTLERLYDGLHVGGKTALDWHGIRHYVGQRQQLQLYGQHSGRLPAWFTSRFPADYHRKRVFDEPQDRMLHVTRITGDDMRPLVSEPERAWLELLSDVGVRQPLSEARELAESTHGMRARVLRELLGRCRSVKTVRLCLKLGQEAKAPWAAKLDASTLPTGSDKPWVTRTRDGLLVLPP
jgi:hypothetical protein